MTLGSAVTEWLTAVGTVGAVVVAVGLTWWAASRERRRTPVLTLTHDESSITSNLGWPHVNMAVHNDAGRHAAHDVQVSVELVAEGQRREWRPSNMTLRWSNMWDRDLAFGAMTIPAGGSRRIDLGDFVDVHLVNREAVPRFQVTTRTGGGLTDYLEIPPCSFDLTVTAENCDATAWRAELTWQRSDDPKKPQDVGLTVSRRG